MRRLCDRAAACPVRSFRPKSSLGTQPARNAIQVGDRLFVAAIELGKLTAHLLQDALALLVGELSFGGDGLPPDDSSLADPLRYYVARY